MTNETRKRVRGWILQFLADQAVGADGLRAQLTPERLQQDLFSASLEVSIDDVRAECSYLAGKRLVEMERFSGAAGRLLGGTRTGVRITSAGIDVKDGTTREPGIDLGVFATV